MNRRIEPRFQVYAPAQIASLDHPEAENAAELVDVSGAGLRILASEAMEAGQIITVETDQHLILADVRNCEQHGNKFSIGAERVHSVAKLSLPRSGSRGDRNQVLVEDFHRRLREELERPQESLPSRSSAAAERFRAYAAKKDPEPVAPEAEALPEEAVAAPVAELAIVAETPVVAAVVQPEPAPVPKPVEPTREMFMPPPVKVDKANSRSRWMAVMVAAALTIVAVAALSFGPFARRAPLQTSVAAKSTAPAAATPAPPAVAPASIADPVAKALAPAPVVPKTSSPVAAPSASQAVITATDRSWITACADGKQAFSKLFVNASKDELAFSTRAVVRMGSAGSAAISVNGKSVGSLGRVGQVVIIELTPNASRFLTPGDAADCTK